MTCTLPKLSFGVLAFTFALLFQCHSGVAQITSKHAFIGEVLGTGGYYSINYERRLNKQDRHFRIGFSVFNDRLIVGKSKWNSTFITLPIAYLYTTGVNNHHFVIGPGITMGQERYSAQHCSWFECDEEVLEKDGFFGFNLRLGYRYQAPDRGLFFEVAATPMYVPQMDDHRNKGFLPLGGLGIGYSF